jgi:DNA-binding transcriptional LysR family regulator
VAQQPGCDGGVDRLVAGARTEQLEYVAAVARLGSFRRAAEELHISQPALSATVRNLERELGVTVLERGRSGAQVSDEGRELLPLILNALDAVDRLRRAADEQHAAVRMVRVGTVNAGTVPLLTPTIAAFRQVHPSTQVEVVGAQEAAIDAGLRKGSFDLGLVTCLAGDDLPPDLDTAPLVSGSPVVCLRHDSRLTELDAVSVDDLLTEPLIVMRAGYLMHRYLHRILDGRTPTVSYSTDGGEMGKLMVAEGLGATVLPDFSVIGDPLERGGIITWRPLAGPGAEVRLAVRRRRSAVHPRAARDLHSMFLQRAAAYEQA